MGSVIGIIIALVVAILVRNDAKSRDMKQDAWAAGVFLVLIVFLPLYFILRKPKSEDLSAEMGENVPEVDSEDDTSFKTTYWLPAKYRLIPHIVVAVIWTLFSVWICAREQEFVSMLFLIFLGFLPFLLEKFEAEIFGKARNK